MDGLGGGAGGQGQGTQKGEQGGLGIVALLRGGAVGVLPGTVDVQGPVLRGEGEADLWFEPQAINGLLDSGLL